MKVKAYGKALESFKTAVITRSKEVNLKINEKKSHCMILGAHHQIRENTEDLEMEYGDEEEWKFGQMASVIYIGTVIAENREK